MNQANSTSCNNQGMRGKNRAVLIAETALQKEKKNGFVFGSLRRHIKRVCSSHVRIFARVVEPKLATVVVFCHVVCEVPNTHSKTTEGLPPALNFSVDMAWW